MIGRLFAVINPTRKTVEFLSTRLAATYYAAVFDPPLPIECIDPQDVLDYLATYTPEMTDLVIQAIHAVKGEAP